MSCGRRAGGACCGSAPTMARKPEASPADLRRTKCCGIEKKAGWCLEMERMDEEGG
jgi:hypothetical protein